MVAKIFTTMVDKAEKANVDRRSLDSRDWFRKQAKAVTSPTPSSLINNTHEQWKNNPMAGHMYLFKYDPKLKETLPYYDIYPLVFPFKSVDFKGNAGFGKGFLGMNLHYLPPKLRAVLMDNLYETINTPRLYNDKTRIQVSYNMLNSMSKFAYFKPCIKMYLFNHLRSPFLHINPTDWDTTLFLNLARFKKASTQKVYRDSVDKIAGR